MEDFKRQRHVPLKSQFSYLSFGEDFEIFDISAGPADWLSSSRPLASKAPILQRATKKYGGGA